jgi:phytol kinase
MSLADGLAAIVGLRLGKRNTYKVFGATKSVAGTATFMIVSLALLVGYVHVSGADIPFVYIAALAGAAGLIENLGAHGLDNLFVPVVIALILNPLVI